MSTIHQIYCTGSTHAGPDAERRQGELAQGIWAASSGRRRWKGSGWTAASRRSSRTCTGASLADLAKDGTLDPTAHDAPRRMFFVPSAGGLQVAGQVSYRPAEREGEPGTYFAHVLVQEEDGADPRWTALDWLRLWGAPGWVHADSAGLPRELPTLASPTDLLRRTPPAIDDRVLLTFLRGAGEPAASEGPGETPAANESGETAVVQEAGETPDPLGFLPERWRLMEPQRRCGWLRQVLSAYLEGAAADPRQPVCLVVEPAVAALLAYAAARLLPEGPLRNEVGFSTFEADPRLARSPLVATWFDDPRAAAAILEGGQSPEGEPPGGPLPGIVVNTLDEGGLERTRPMHKYAAAIVQELIDRGSEAVDRDLAAFTAAKVVRPSQLESLGVADEIVSALLETGTLADDAWRSSPQATQCVRLRLGQRLAGMDDLDAGLKTAADGPAYLTVVDLLTAKPPLRDARRPLVHLLKVAPPERILGLLRLAGVPDDDKVTVLLRHVHTRGALPVGCEFMWEEFARPGEGPRRAGAVLLARIPQPAAGQGSRRVVPIGPEIGPSRDRLEPDADVPTPEGEGRPALRRRGGAGRRRGLRAAADRGRGVARGLPEERAGDGAEALRVGSQPPQAS